MSDITLRNGGTAPAAIVRTTDLTLSHLMGTDPIALIELASAARDPEHVLFGKTGAKLIELAMIEGVDSQGRALMRPYMRDIILSATHGEGLEIGLRSPAGAE